MNYGSALAASCLLFWAVLFQPANGAEAPALKTGAAFRQQLASPAGISWTAAPLRRALQNLAEAKQIAIVIDRRIDPDQTIDFNSGEGSLEEALRSIAVRLNSGVSIFDSTVYIGPPATTARLATLAAIAHERKKLAMLPAIQTTELMTPRELLEQWSQATGVKLAQLDKVPHDLWPVLSLPTQTPASRITLLLAGFDLAIEMSADGAAGQIVAMPEQVVMERNHAGGANPTQRAAQIQKQFPSAKIEVRGSHLHVVGSFEDQDLIGRLLRGEQIRRTEVRGGELRYTLAVENQPVGAVAQALATRLKMSIGFDPAVKEKLEQRVSFKVDNATLEELLGQMLDPVGLRYQIKENEIRILPTP